MVGYGRVGEVTMDSAKKAGYIGGLVLAVGVLIAACGGSAVDRELEQSKGGDEATTPTPVEPATEAVTPAETEALSPRGDGDAIRYGDMSFRVGDHVRLKRRVGLLSPAAAQGRGQVEAAVGKRGQITGVVDPEGLVEITWDAQEWTLHGGYSWQESLNVEVRDVEGATSKAAGTIHLEPFTTTIHIGFVELL